jgi:hypothetical protein
VLTDPERRAHYDKTGEDQPQSDKRSRIISEVAGLITEIINQAPDVEHSDIIGMARKVFRETIHKNMAIRKAQEAKVAKLRKALARIVKRNKKADPILHAILEGGILSQESVLAQIDVALEMNRECIVLLEHYEYKVDVRKATTGFARMTFT